MLFNRYNPLPVGGVTFSPEYDAQRLTRQLDRVRALMLDGQWRTLSAIAVAVQGSEAGVSARLRDLRRHEYGGYVIDRRRVGDPRRGLFHYRMAPAEP